MPIVHRSAKWKAYRERILASRMRRVFSVQMGYVTDEMRSLPWAKPGETQKRALETRGAASNEIQKLADGLPGGETTTVHLVANARASYAKGARDIHADLDMGTYGVSWELANAGAANYVSKLRDLELSQRYGSITRTTKTRIVEVIQEMIDNGTTYDDAARQIRGLGREGVFSRARAELIATNQVGNAYGEGNREMVVQFERDTGLQTVKEWDTVNDDRVTDECMAYQDLGEIPTNQPFEVMGVSDMRAPRYTNPRCRCATTYRVLDPGEAMPEGE